jgi:hypothetical protein
VCQLLVTGTTGLVARSAAMIPWDTADRARTEAVCVICSRLVLILREASEVCVGNRFLSSDYLSK